jgi:hypothetical protein
LAIKKCASSKKRLLWSVVDREGSIRGVNFELENESLRGFPIRKLCKSLKRPKALSMGR